MGATVIVSGILFFKNAYQIFQEFLYVKSESPDFVEAEFYGPAFYIFVNVFLGVILLICGINAILNININFKLFVPIVVVVVLAFTYVHIYICAISPYGSAIKLPNDVVMFARFSFYPSAILYTFHVYLNKQLHK